MKYTVYLVEFDNKKLLAYYICDIDKYEPIFFNRELLLKFPSLEQAIFYYWIQKITTFSNILIKPICEVLLTYDMKNFDIIIDENEMFYMYEKYRFMIDKKEIDELIGVYKESRIIFNNFLEGEFGNVLNCKKEDIILDADQKIEFCLSKICEILEESVDCYQRLNKIIIRKNELLDYEMIYFTQLLRKNMPELGIKLEIEGINAIRIQEDSGEIIYIREYNFGKEGILFFQNKDESPMKVFETNMYMVKSQTINDETGKKILDFLNKNFHLLFFEKVLNNNNKGELSIVKKSFFDFKIDFDFYNEINELLRRIKNQIKVIGDDVDEEYCWVD